MPGPCAGLTVLDFSYGMPGAICTLVMADYGAEVIKVEPPGGDPFRFQPAWISWNRGKKGIVLDLTTIEGRGQAIRLAGEADVLVESFRPGDMAEWGLDYESLSELYPRLVYCSITGFGQKGPFRRVKGYEGVVAAKAGRMLNLQGLPNREGPVFSAVYTGSWHASQAAVRGIISALRIRDLHGIGQWVQTSIIQSLSAPHDNNAGPSGLISRQLQRMDPDRFPARAGGGRGHSSIGYIPVRTKDGKWLQHAHQRVYHIEGHLKAIGLGHLLEDERFKKVDALTAQNREILRREIIKAQLTKTLDEWMDIYIKHGDIAAEPYRTSIEAMDHPAVAANTPPGIGKNSRVGTIRQLGLLADLKATPGQIGGPAPELGQHTVEITARLSRSTQRATKSKITGVENSMPTHALEGVTILDLASVQAAPMGPTFLADLGARVIKLDPTDEQQEEGRRSTAVQIAEPRVYSGKEGIMVDLKTQEGKEIAHKLISKADIIVHSYRLGVSERLKVDWETCQKINPRAVYVWMGTYGEKGDYGRRPGAHPIPGAVMGGPMRQMGRGMPPPPEQKMDIEEIVEATRWIMRSNWGPDQNTSAALATAMMLGLRSRDATGTGQHIHVTMLNANSWANADEYFDYAGRPDYQVPDEEIFGLHALYRLYPTAAGWIFLACLFDEEFKVFCETIGREDLLTDRRFTTREARLKNDADLIHQLSVVFITRPAVDWEELLTRADIACVQADETEEGAFYADHPHAKANALSVEVEHPIIGKYLRFGGMVELSRTPGLYRTSIQIGQHTKPLLREMGYNNQEIEDLGQRGIIQWANSLEGGEP
ncbi:hypothetical protein FIM02_00365 [SAR202 cluster bacterium AD-802-E10_MRT_200m]|nr:hypothetical protein [SAR202 cluster bacterium AD-802-E10_MRT_200m]